MKIKVHWVDPRFGQGVDNRCTNKFVGKGVFILFGRIQVPNDIYCLLQNLILAQAKADGNSSLAQNLQDTKQRQTCALIGQKSCVVK